VVPRSDGSVPVPVEVTYEVEEAAQMTLALAGRIDGRPADGDEVRLVQDMFIPESADAVPGPSAHHGGGGPEVP
jgi:hypothetical protein